MFASKLDALLICLAPAANLKLFPPYGQRRTWSVIEPRRSALFEARAQRAMAQGIPVLSLSDAADLFGGGRDAFLDAQRSRREILKAIALHCLSSGGDLHAFARMGDIIYAICEEAFWGSPEAYAGFEEGHELNDISLETANLLAACAYLFSDVEMPALTSAFVFAKMAVNARVLKPFLKKDDFQVFRLQNALLPCAVEDVLTASLILSADDHERWQCVRKAALLLDQVLITMPKDGEHRANLEGRVRASAAFSFCVDLLSRACNHELEFRADAGFREMVHLPLEMHIAGRWFVNSGSGSMMPKLSPDELFEMARFSGDQDLMGLAAVIQRLTRDSAMARFTDPSLPLLRQAHQALLVKDLMAAPAREPAYDEIALPDIAFYARRTRGFYAALTGDAREAGAHPSSGNFILFYGGEPIFFDADDLSATQDHTLPTIDGIGQESAFAVKDAMVEEKGMYTLISMNIAPAYAKRADLLSWQRTLMFMPMERGVRLMEVYDFDAGEHVVAFHFITPEKPVLYPTSARIGPVTLQWEGTLDAKAVRLPGDMQAYRLTLSRTRPERSGSETFIITAEGN